LTCVFEADFFFDRRSKDLNQSLLDDLLSDESVEDSLELLKDMDRFADVGLDFGVDNRRRLDMSAFWEAEIFCKKSNI
jgi:hypothetical protein